MVRQRVITFNPEIPPDVRHASLIREEAIDWLETNHPGELTFKSGKVLQMAGEKNRRWLIGRLRQRGIGNEELFSLPGAADALTALFLRSHGIKFQEAVESVLGGDEDTGPREPRYGGVWNRLIRIATKRMRRRIAARLLGCGIFSLLRDPQDQRNCLIIITPLGPGPDGAVASNPKRTNHERVFQSILERPAPSCWVLSPFRELLFLDADQLPTGRRSHLVDSLR